MPHHVRFAQGARQLLPRHHLRASNAAPRTVSTYHEGATRFATYLAAQGMPANVPDIRRRHVEAFVVDILSHFKPATANNRYRSLLSFFKFLLEEGEIAQSPMARMQPPLVPEQPPRVLSEAE